MSAGGNCQEERGEERPKDFQKRVLKTWGCKTKDALEGPPSTNVELEREKDQSLKGQGKNNQRRKEPNRQGIPNPSCEK